MRNIDVIRKLYTLPRDNKEDRRELMSLLANDIHYKGIGKEEAKGRAAVERLFQKYESSGQTHIEFETRHIAENGDCVLVDNLNHFTVDGVTTSITFSLVFRLRDGKITYWQEHYDIAKLESLFKKSIPVTEIASD